MSNKVTWEEAVLWLRNQPEQQTLVKDCYYDDPLIASAGRYADGEEWHAVQALLPTQVGLALDIGAGRGISSFALARDGWTVTALEPDFSSIVGACAIQSLAAQAQLTINVVAGWGEKLPFASQSFDLVFGRQVLHHAQNLQIFCSEVTRILKPGGRFITIREHVISRPEDLEIFLENHPLQHLYGGENAYLLDTYLSVLSQGNLQLSKVIAPFESAINYSPLTNREWQAVCHKSYAKFLGTNLANQLTDNHNFLGRLGLACMATYLSRKNSSPGRLYSFVAIKL